MTEAIHTFETSLIAFHRPIKRTYFCMGWNGDRRKWIPYTTDIPNLVMHRSTTTRSGKVNIRVATRLGAAAVEIEVYSDGYYLKSGNIRITLVRQTGNALPPTLIKKEYTMADASLPAVESDTRLWRVVPPPTEEEIAQANATAAAQASQTTLKAIPRRIAWLIAEDACKNKESCPITTNELSPITAAVTSCFHVFETDSLSEWFARNPTKTKCPVCREVCLMTKAYQSIEEA
jgi:hypothetical protein